MQKKLALALIVVFVLSIISPALASPALDAVNELKASGKWSNEYLNQVVIDLISVPNGSVTTYTYMGADEQLTAQNFTVEPQENNVASDKIVRFVFTLTNQYRPETTLPIEVSQDHNTVNTYVYGTMKDEATWAIVNGLVDCLGNQPISNHPDNDDDSNNRSSGSSIDYSWAEKYYPEQIEETIINTTATFSLNSTTVTVSDTSSSSEPETVEMDVTPEIKDSRTFVPIRYLAYSLGVSEAGIHWNGVTKTATIEVEDAEVSLTIGSITEIVNGTPIEMDTAPYIKEIDTGGRVMLPARWVAEPLGATATWNPESQQMVIEFPQQAQEQEQGQ